MARVLTAIALAIIGFGVIFLGTPVHFFGFISLVALLCLLEFYDVLRSGGEPSIAPMGVITGLLFMVIVYLENFALLTAFIAIMVALTFGLAVLLGGRSPFKRGSNTLAGVFYIAGTLGVLALIRKEPSGELYISLLIIATSFADIFAYYTGRSIGKTKLAPKVSPNKTVEGFVGGLIGSTLSSIVAMYILLPELGLIHSGAVGFMIGIFGPMGDLTESALKRAMSVKDSGKILPGHGGMLDRADALMFSGPAFYLYFTLALAS